MNDPLSNGLQPGQSQFQAQTIRASCATAPCQHCGASTAATATSAADRGSILCNRCNNEAWLGKDVFGLDTRGDMRELADRLSALDPNYRILELRRDWDGAVIEIAISAYVQGEAADAIHMYKRRLAPDNY